MFDGMKRALDWGLRAAALLYLLALVVGIIIYKAAFFNVILFDPFFAVYGLTVTTYILSRFLVSLFHRDHARGDLEPTVAVVVPAFNEVDAIAGTIEAIVSTDYPADRLEVVVVNDGSTDGTLAEIRRVAATDPRVRVINFEENRGKRAAMAAGIRETRAEIVAFVDSDSILDPDAIRVGVQPFADDRIGAVAGHADVLNVRESWLTRMQAVRYFVAFKVLKAAESVFGAVTCCSGCFALYRRAAIVPHLEDWEHQTFLGRRATFGDDRSLTNHVLRDWRITYESRAVSRTIVPSEMGQFLRQQLRWKRSWTRESLIVSRFIWRKHPLAALATYVGILLPLLAPLAVVRAILWKPLVLGTGLAPFVYILGIYAMALIYGLYYAVRRGTGSLLWFYGVGFVFFYLVFLVWQTYWAVVTSWRNEWGTRSPEPERA